MLFCFFMDTLHSDISDCPDCLGVTKNVLLVHNLDTAVPYRLGSILQYTDLPVYHDSPLKNSVHRLPKINY